MAFNRDLLKRAGVTNAHLNAYGDVFSKYGTVKIKPGQLPTPTEKATAPKSELMPGSVEKVIEANNNLNVYDPSGKILQGIIDHLEGKVKEGTVTIEELEFADGGYVDSYEDGGEVEGPGTGESDSIDAKLSDGEFVFTAKAVEVIGADNLQRIMKEAERQYDEKRSLSQARSLFGKFLKG